MGRRALQVIGTVALLAAAAGAEEIPRSALGPRTVAFTYEATLEPPPGAKLVELWLPLPRDEDQTVRELRVTGTADPTVRVLGPSGDRVAYVRVERPSGAVTVKQTGTVVRRELAIDPATASRTDAVDRAAFAPELAPSRFVVVNDEIRAIAARTTAGKDGTIARARALYDWVYEHMQYDKSVPGWGLGDIPYCLKVGKGNCTDFHTLFIALARASGIPARWNIGFPLAYGDGRTAPVTDQAVAGYHCWAEFFAPGAGWIPVDISEARKHPELKDYFFGHLSGNRILVSRARGFVLGADPTERNYLVYPVARVDGADASAVTWKFTYSDRPDG
jgi:transglutaminase-like putative cysteine protease